MPVFVRYLLSFIGGAAIGGVISYFWTKSRCEKAHREDTEALNKYIREKYGIEEDQDESNEQEEEISDPMAAYISTDVEKHRIVNVRPKYTPVDYTSMYKGSGDVPGQPPLKFETITADDYGIRGFEEVTLHYYADDNTLEVDKEEPYENLDLFQEAILDTISKIRSYNDDYTIYLRDIKNRIDYQIVVHVYAPDRERS